MSRVLITAPWIGEIGWELMSWQGRVRRVFLEGNYERIIVLGGAGKAAFYDGMPLEYRVVDLSHVPGTAYEDRRLSEISREPLPAEQLSECVRDMVDGVIAEQEALGLKADVLQPSYAGQLWPCDAKHQHIIRYQRKVEHPSNGPWVVLIQRTRTHETDRNWSAANWYELSQHLRDRGVRTTVYPNESQAAIAELSGCDLAIGQSTGGLHLAALCGCPTMVWSVQSYLMWKWEITNRQRYETWWNPLGSPVILHDVAQLPSPDEAADQVIRALHTIGRRTGSAVSQVVFRSKWLIRNMLRRQVIEPRRYEHWPWSVQKFIRYQLA